MKTRFLLCINNDGYQEALVSRKFYQVILDTEASAEGMVRVIDESGEDYLYPLSCFVEVTLSQSIEKKLKRRLHSIGRQSLARHLLAIPATPGLAIVRNRKPMRASRL
jgi:hypothetical protein